MPLGIQYCRAYSKKVNLYLRAGCNIDLLQYGQYHCSKVKPYEINGANEAMFELNILSKEDALLYPSIFFGAGIDFYTSWSKWHIGLSLQKATTPYLSGYYRFYNLKVSSSSWGKYQVYGDYIALDMGLTLKKFRKKYRQMKA